MFNIDTSALFPTLFARTLNVLSDEQCDKLLEYCKTTSYDSDRSSLEKNVLKLFPDIKNLIEDIFLELTHDYMGGEKKCKFSVSNSWILVVAPNDEIQKHKHPNSFWSGVIYFSDNLTPIVFYKPKEETSFLLKTDNPTSFNIGIVHHQPQKNEVIFFPSHLYHTVDTNTFDENRYSLSFNIMPNGIFGDNTASFHTKIL